MCEKGGAVARTGVASFRAGLRFEAPKRQPMLSSLRFYWRRRAIRRAWSCGTLTFSEALCELDRLARAA
jgi:hypothetical protein